MEMKRAFILACALFILLALASALFTQPDPENTNRKKGFLIGTWQKRGVTYVFEDAATLSVTRLGGGKSGFIRCPYTWFALGMHECISFQKDPADNLSLQVILVGEVTDSTAVLALGTPFIRSGPGGGLTGTWKHAEHLTRIEWTFGLDTVEYRKIVFDLSTGRETTVEEYQGQWRLAEKKYEPGSYEVTFGENKRATVLPIVYRDVMYLFDLSPGKSFFKRVKGKPLKDERLTRNDQKTE
jgi:hypothetical protein